MSVAVLSAGVGHVRASDRLRHGVLRRLFPGEKKKKKVGVSWVSWGFLFVVTELMHGLGRALAILAAPGVAALGTSLDFPSFSSLQHFLHPVIIKHALGL